LYDIDNQDEQMYSSASLQLHKITQSIVFQCVVRLAKNKAVFSAIFCQNFKDLTVGLFVLRAWGRIKNEKK
jgi:hypothetical protein